SGSVCTRGGPAMATRLSFSFDCEDHITSKAAEPQRWWAETMTQHGRDLGRKRAARRELRPDHPDVRAADGGGAWLEEELEVPDHLLGVQDLMDRQQAPDHLADGCALGCENDPGVSNRQ